MVDCTIPPGRESPTEMLDLNSWRKQWSNATWRKALHESDAVENANVREATRRGVPLGGPEFIGMLEEQAGRPLQIKPAGRPRLHRPTPSD